MKYADMIHSHATQNTSEFVPKNRTHTIFLHWFKCSKVANRCRNLVFGLEVSFCSRCCCCCGICLLAESSINSMINSIIISNFGTIIEDFMLHEGYVLHTINSIVLASRYVRNSDGMQDRLIFCHISFPRKFSNKKKRRNTAKRKKR